MLDSAETLVDFATRYFDKKDDRVKQDTVMAMFLVIHHDLGEWIENTEEGKKFFECHETLFDKIDKIFYEWTNETPFNFEWCEVCFDNRDDSHIWDDGSREQDCE